MTNHQTDSIMAMNWKTFFTRTWTALVFGAVMLTGLLGPWYAFWLLFALVQCLCIREYFQLMSHKGITVPGPAIQWGLQLWAFTMISFLAVPALQEHKIIPAALIVLPALLLFGEGLRKQGSAFSVLSGLGSVAYIVLPLNLLMLLYRIDAVLPAGLIFLIWINDTMAYVVGSFIGKTPFSQISPKKTWEGTGGGAVLTVLVAFIYGKCNTHLPVQHWVVLALCAAVAGTMGDLFESKLKREAGVKDSGSFMPGHGGALDRFDSLLLATPFAYAYAILFLQ
ncbi:MAG: phosphatidate cytidylyltransferase [Chitinophagaceae bacterium]